MLPKDCIIANYRDSTDLIYSYIARQAIGRYRRGKLNLQLIITMHPHGILRVYIQSTNNFILIIIKSIQKIVAPYFNHR